MYQILTKKILKKLDPLFFISIGVACNALTVLHKRGILKEMLGQRYFDDKELVNNDIHPRPLVIQAALKSLLQVGVVIKKDNLWLLTSFGFELLDKIGLIELIFSGYSTLLSKQILISEGGHQGTYADCNGEVIAQASDNISDEHLEKIFIEIIRKLPSDGTIADLGCGSGSRLINLVKTLKRKGIGFDLSKRTIALARKNSTDCSDIKFYNVDVTKMKRQWEEIEILLQCFMLHDIVPEKKCTSMLNSFKKKFPRIKYLIVLDIVAREENATIINPGFEYVHSLLNIEARTYNETIGIFKNSGYQLLKEIKTEVLPDTYIWLLKVDT